MSSANSTMVVPLITNDVRQVIYIEQEKEGTEVF